MREGDKVPIVATGNKVFIVDHGHGVNATLFVSFCAILVFLGLP